MNAQSQTVGTRALVIVRALIVGLLVGMIAANVWPLLLLDRKSTRLNSSHSS